MNTLLHGAANEINTLAHYCANNTTKTGGYEKRTTSFILSSIFYLLHPHSSLLTPHSLLLSP
jgi:hypothetical protein